MEAQVFLHSTIVFILGSFLLFVGHKALGTIWKLNLSEQLTELDNPAVIMFSFGKLLAKIMILCGLVQGVSVGILNDLSYIFSRFTISFFYLILGSFCTFKFLWFRKTCLTKLLELKTLPAAIIAIGVFLSFSIALLAKGRIYSDSLYMFSAQGFISTLGIFGINLLVLYKVEKSHLKKIIYENTSASLVILGDIVSYSLIWVSFTSGFDSLENIQSLGVEWSFVSPLIVGIFIVAISKICFEFLWTPHSSMKTEIMVDNNWSLSLLGATLQIGVSLLFLLSLL
jgi:hypothetical protein